MKWPYTERVATSTAWAVVGVGVAMLAAVAGIFATMHGSQPNYRWWWPTEWMWVPSAIIVAGLVALVAPIRHKTARRETEGPAQQIMVHSEMSGRAENVVQAAHVTGNIYQGPVNMASAVPMRNDLETARDSIGIGEGVAGWKGSFQRAWNEVAGRPVVGPDGAKHPIAFLGASTEVHRAGPGLVQYLDSPHSEFGWVMCALPGQRVVVISGEIWHELQAAGRAARTDHPLSALGYPAPSETATLCIDESTVEIRLAGGEWGAGRLVRTSTRESWRWEPKPAFDINRTRDANVGTRELGRRLRMRIVATMPWEIPDDLEILPVRKAALLRGLADSELVRYIEKLSRCRGIDLSATAWDTSPFSNTSDRLGCECRLATPDGRTIVTAEVLTHLPGAGSSSVVTCIQVSVHDLDAWRESRAAEVRLSTTEVAEFYAIAAVATTTTLSTALGDPLPMRYFSPPKVQLVLATDAEDHTKPRPLLDQYVALEPLGQNGRGPTDSLEIAVTTAPLVDSACSAELMRDALAFAARKFGFSGATAENFE